MLVTFRGQRVDVDLITCWNFLRAFQICMLSLKCIGKSNDLMCRRALFVCLFVCLSLFLVSYQEMLYHPQVSQLSYNVD